MKMDRAAETGFEDSDTMRAEYDFSGATRGVTAARYAEGSNVVVIEADVRDVFPSAASVNEALRALAPLLRKQPDKKGRPVNRSRSPRPSGKPGPSSAGGRGG
jgi:hypothetical protein